MSVTKQLEQTIQYILEGVSEIFSPSRDDYPETGVQPFDGEVPKNPLKH